MKTKHALLQTPIRSTSVVTSHRTPSPVMDILPWPTGYGLTGREVWWNYVLSQDEQERLDNLLGLALLDKKICTLLVEKRDPALLTTFGLSEKTQTWLKGIEATNLRDLSRAIVATTNPSFSYTEAKEAA